jgi:hypothetical protein
MLYKLWPLSGLVNIYGWRVESETGLGSSFVGEAAP